MSVDDSQLLSAAAFLVAGVLSARTAWGFYRISEQKGVGIESLVWAGLAATFLLFSQLRLARGLGWLEGWGGMLRALAREQGLYADRRMLQITASIAVAVVAVALIVYGLIWVWHHIKRDRLAISFAALAVGFAIIRFISLHEVDAWNAAMPYARPIVELIAAVGASTLAMMRLSRLAKSAR